MIARGGSFKVRRHKDCLMIYYFRMTRMKMIKIGRDMAAAILNNLKLPPID